MSLPRNPPMNWTLIIVLPVIILGSCASPTGQTSDSRTPANDSRTLSATNRSPTPVRPTVTATTPAPSPSATPTPTITPTPTQTATPTHTPTWTSIPTLPQEEAFPKILDLYSNNGDCQLPCRWGITPGVTTWQEAREIIGPLGLVYGPITKGGEVEKYDTSFVIPNTIDTTGLGYFGTDFWVEHGIVKAISTNSSWIDDDFDYSLAGVLQKFGKPDEIWFEIITDTQYLPHYTLELYYGKKGIVFQTTGNASIRGNKLSICPQGFKLGEFPPGVLLWSPSVEVTFDNLDQTVLGGVTNPQTYEFAQLEDLADQFDTTDFYETYLDPHTNKCIEIDPAKVPK